MLMDHAILKLVIVFVNLVIMVIDVKIKNVNSIVDQMEAVT